MKSKLVKSWCAYIVFVLLFATGVELYHRSHKDANAAFKCRISVHKDLIVDAVEKQKIKTAPKKNEESDFLYEKTKYGTLPKISMSGKKVFDTFSARTEAKKFVKIAISLERESIDDVIKLVSKLGSNKVTFIIPNYIDNFKNIVSVILEHGHEVFLQLPTQGAVTDKQNVSPFLANTNREEIVDNLLKLLASSTKVIGIANVSSTLLTQSAKDMEVITLELAKRGLAFFDANPQNDILKTLSQKTGLTYLYLSEAGNGQKPKEFSTYFVRFQDTDAFMKTLPEGVALAPISQERSK